MTTLEQAFETVKILDSKKAENVKLFEIGEISSLCDYMIIASGRSSTQVRALADELEFKLNEQGFSVSHIEGHRSDTWILLDYVDIIVHIFSEEARQYYNLERLWQDGKEIDISEILANNG